MVVEWLWTVRVGMTPYIMQMLKENVGSWGRRRQAMYEGLEPGKIIFPPLQDHFRMVASTSIELRTLRRIRFLRLSLE